MDSLLLHKLMILFMLDRASFTMTYETITGFIIDREYCNVEVLDNVISELTESDFVATDIVRNTIHYKITNQGEEALSLFENRLNYNTKQDILEYLHSSKIALKRESEIYADYAYNEYDSYTVKCIIKDRRETLLDIKFDVPSKSQAETICNRWREKSSAIYDYLIRELWTNN